jgi:hypothetical protein
LNSEPAPGSQWTLLDNTATPATANPINGVFTNAPQNGVISASYGGKNYYFRVNYAGGDRNDVVLTATATAPVTSIGPAVGPAAGGTSVTLLGTGFIGATAVMFGSVPSDNFTVVSDTQITAVSPVGIGSVDVAVVAPGGTSSASSVGRFTYVAAPTITAISPAAGPTAGSTLVTITGTGFTGAAAVAFGAVLATSFTVMSDSQITVLAPAQQAGVADVTIVTAGGASSTQAADRFAYVAAPMITGISPTAGPTAGSTSVTITGTGFTGIAAVAFGAVPASSFTVISDSQITVLAPAQLAGVVDVMVVTVGGPSSKLPTDRFTYLAAPTITTISPAAGPTAGGVPITITGRGFTDATTVDFGNVPISNFKIDSDTQITVTIPAHGPDTVDVRVITAGGVSSISSADQFTYAAGPMVIGVIASAGPAAGGTSVTITGTGFSGATAVNFGALPTSSFTIDSDTQITAITPAALPGMVDVTVVAPGGMSSTASPAHFIYAAVPTVAAIGPAAGPTAGGAWVTITGTGFTTATAVNFGALAASGFSIDSDSQITAISPAGVGIADVTVVTAGGVSSRLSSDQFTFLSLDVDGNGQAGGLTDGMLLLRYMFGFAGRSLTAKVLGNGAARTDPSQIASYLSVATTMLDVDGNDAVYGYTDGMLLLRYLFDFRGRSLTANVLGTGATRTDPATIAIFLDTFQPLTSAKSQPAKAGVTTAPDQGTSTPADTVVAPADLLLRMSNMDKMPEAHRRVDQKTAAALHDATFAAGDSNWTERGLSPVANEVVLHRHVRHGFRDHRAMLTGFGLW